MRILRKYAHYYFLPLIITLQLTQYQNEYVVLTLLSVFVCITSLMTLQLTRYENNYVVLTVFFVRLQDDTAIDPVFRGFDEDYVGKGFFDVIVSGLLLQNKRLEATPEDSSDHLMFLTRYFCIKGDMSQTRHIEIKWPVKLLFRIGEGF